MCLPQDKMVVIIVCDFFPILPTFRDGPSLTFPDSNFLPGSLQGDNDRNFRDQTFTLH